MTRLGKQIAVPLLGAALLWGFVNTSGHQDQRVREPRGKIEVKVVSKPAVRPPSAPPRGNVGGVALPEGGLPRTTPALARALLQYLNNKNVKALQPVWDYAAREFQAADLEDHQHLLCMTLVAAARKLTAQKPRYITREQEVIVTYLLPKTGGRQRLRELLLTLLNRPLSEGKADTVYRQLVDGHLALTFDLRKLLARSKLVTISPGAVVADVGCGVGTQTLELARAVGPRGKVLAVDIDPGVISFLRHLKGVVPEGARIVPVKSVMNDVSLTRGSVDLAMIHGINFLFAVEGARVPHHAFKLMRSIHRSLKEDGQLLVRSYQPSQRLAGYLSRCGFKKEGEFDARCLAATGPVGSHDVDRLVLFSRAPRRLPSPTP